MPSLSLPLVVGVPPAVEDAAEAAVAVAAAAECVLQEPALAPDAEDFLSSAGLAALIAEVAAADLAAVDSAADVAVGAACLAASAGDAPVAAESSLVAGKIPAAAAVANAKSRAAVVDNPAANYPCTCGPHNMRPTVVLEIF